MRAAGNTAIAQAAGTTTREPLVMTRSDFAGAVLTIDLDAIVENYRLLQSRAGDAECAGVVKADAYGLGVDQVAPALASAGCRRFFVSSIDEGLTLRQVLDGLYPNSLVYVLTGLPQGAEEIFAQSRLTPVLVSLEQIDSWAAFCRDRGEALPAIIKFDTGMARLGLSPPELDALADDHARISGMTVDYVMSHLACADDPDDPMNAAQLKAFKSACKRLPAAAASLANSPGIYLGKRYHFDLVRPGAALYGVSPRKTGSNPMRPVVSLRGKILQLRDVDRGISVGYGAAHRTAKPARLATVAVGYADGYLRSLGNRGAAHIGKTRVPVVGRVSMDLTVFDVSDVPENSLRPGDYVDLLGTQHGVDDLASEAGTIGYEILTSLGHRYHRIYTGGA